MLIVLSVAIGVGVAALFARAEPVRSFLRVLSPVPLVFLALFLFTDPISKLAFPDEAQRAHDRRGQRRRRSWWCCSTSCRRTR